MLIHHHVVPVVTALGTVAVSLQVFEGIGRGASLDHIRLDMRPHECFGIGRLGEPEPRLAAVIAVERYGMRIGSILSRLGLYDHDSVSGLESINGS